MMPTHHNLTYPSYSPDASGPLPTFDFHAEAPPRELRRHRPTISRNERQVNGRQRTEARVVFNNVIAGHYHATGNGYSDVGALFVTWEATDLRVNGEVKELRKIFDRRLGYTTDLFQIPSENSDTALTSRVAHFVHQYNDPTKLLILYYAGHCFDENEDSDDEDQLSLAPGYAGDGETGKPQRLFHNVINLLRKTRSDVLLIVDSWLAARSFSEEELGRHKFELLTSSLFLNPSPGKPGSFTTTLIEVIDELLGSEKYNAGFSTSILYRHLYHHQALTHFKPLLFDQSQFDYGKIWLRPQLAPSDHAPSTNRSEFALDLKLHLTLTQHDHIGQAMNELAKEMRYLPHVCRIDVRELHAGGDDVNMFLKELDRVNIVKKVIRKLKQRVAVRKRLEQMPLSEEDPLIETNPPPSYYEVVNNPNSSSTQSWQYEFAQFSDGSRVPETINRVRESGRPTVSRYVHQRRRVLLIPHVISITFIFDFTVLFHKILAAIGLRRENISGSEDDARSDSSGVNEPGPRERPILSPPKSVASSLHKSQDEERRMSQTQLGSPFPESVIDPRGRLKKIGTFHESQDEVSQMWQAQMGSLFPASIIDPQNALKKFNVYHPSFWDRIKLAFEAYSGEPWLWQPIKPPGRAIDEGKTRLEWLCHCGRTRRIDVSWELSRKILDNRSLASWNLRRSARIVEGDFLSHSDQQNSTPSASNKQANIYATSPRQQTAVSVPPQTFGIQSQADISSRSGSDEFQSLNSNQKERYLLLCVERWGRNRAAEMPVFSSDSDDVFFERFKIYYRDLRGFWQYWLDPRQLAFCHATHFEKWNVSKLAKVCDGMPDVGRVDYEYVPKPPAEPYRHPPVSEHEWLERIYDNVQTGGLREAIPLLPMRTKRHQIHVHLTGREKMWGLHARLRPSAKLIIIWMMFITVGGWVFIPLWLRAHGGDLQNATTPIIVIMTALAVLWIPLSGKFTAIS
ncbi:MAG: hypothetical protein Q9227_009367 [Pyrenula ochraceoflavens]